jgi:hypothetical protein
MKRRPTDDEILAREGIWQGTIRELRQRMADFTVDSVRFGALSPETRSGSPNDRRVTKRSEEVVTAVFVRDRVGYEQLQLFTKASDGGPLEGPDLARASRMGRSWVRRSPKSALQSV